MDSCTDVWVVRITGGWKEKDGLAFHNIHIYLLFHLLQEACCAWPDINRCSHKSTCQSKNRRLGHFSIFAGGLSLISYSHLCPPTPSCLFPMSNISVRFYWDRNTGQRLSSLQPLFHCWLSGWKVEVNVSGCVAAFGSNLHYRDGITEIFSLFLESKTSASAHVGKSTRDLGEHFNPNQSSSERHFSSTNHHIIIKKFREFRA